ncbi:hypothetical protein C1S81_20175 [Mycolicibacterium neoaurum]|nr:hypothetical protein C1S81_20175 [Mycolicibacterium neoaurum]
MCCASNLRLVSALAFAISTRVLPAAAMACGNTGTQQPWERFSTFLALVYVQPILSATTVTARCE